MSDVYHHPRQSQLVWHDNAAFRERGEGAARVLWKPSAGVRAQQSTYRHADPGQWINLLRSETPIRMRGENAQQIRLTGPVRLIQRVAQAWSLTNDELAELLAYRDPHRATELLRGTLPLRDADREDRARLMYLIHETLADLFVDLADECRWMRTPLPLLDGFAPLEYMIARRIPGMVSVHELIEQRLANR